MKLRHRIIKWLLSDSEKYILSQAINDKRMAIADRILKDKNYTREDSNSDLLELDEINKIVR